MNGQLPVGSTESYYPYFNARYAKVAKQIMDKMKQIKPKAYRINGREGLSLGTIRNQFYQGARYLVDKVDPSYREIRNLLLLSIQEDDETGTKYLLFDWRAKALADKASETDLSEEFFRGEEIDSIAAYTRASIERKRLASLKRTIVERHKEENAELAESVRVDSPANAGKLPDSWMDDVIFYIESATLESPPLVIEGLALSENEIAQVTAMLEDAGENMMFEISENKIFCHRTTQKL